MAISFIPDEETPPVMYEDEDEELDDPALQERKQLKRDLLKQLDQIKADVALLENWTNRAKGGHDGQQVGQDDVSNLM